MAIVYLDGGRITGLSTDAKPDRDTSDASQPALTVQAGSVFIETDTGSRFVHNGTAWIQEPFDSINSALGNSGGITQSQHFVDWFTGRTLNTIIWNEGYVGADSVRGMADEIDGGYKMVVGNGVGYCQYINFNNKEQYNAKGSVHISVHKGGTSAARGGWFSGLMNGTPQGVTSWDSNATAHHAGHYIVLYY